MNNASTQQEVENALALLKAARAALVTKPATPDQPANVTELVNKIAELEELDLKASDYPADKWNAYLTALAHAKALIESGASQEEIDAALAALMEAYNALMASADPTPDAPNTPDESTTDGSAEEVAVDYSALKAAIKKAEGLSEKDYTTKSWKALKEALEKAKKALISDEQSTVDVATKELNDAIDALKEKANLLWVWILIAVLLVGGGVAGAIVLIDLQKKKNVADSTPLVEYDINEDDNAGDVDEMDDAEIVDDETAEDVEDVADVDDTADVESAEVTDETVSEDVADDNAQEVEDNADAEDVDDDDSKNNN